jgi:hypothetical protein
MAQMAGTKTLEAPPIRIWAEMTETQWRNQGQSLTGKNQPLAFVVWHPGSGRLDRMARGILNASQ